MDTVTNNAAEHRKRIVRPRTILSLTAAAALLVFLLYSIVNIFNLRFSAGDPYPPYSSYRADPMGCKALFETFESLPETEVKRNVRPVDELSNAKQSVLLMVGVSHPDILKTDMNLIQWVRQGGRLAAFLSPNFREAESSPCLQSKCPCSSETDEDVDKPIRHDRFWGFEVKSGLSTLVKEAQATPAPEVGVGRSPFHMYSANYFDLGEETDWRPIYLMNGRPVVIERSEGTGSILLSTSSFPMSNEALGKANVYDFISWLVGDRSTVVFDERIHGVGEQRNIMWLARRYRLHWLGINLVILAALVVWSNLFPIHNIAGESPETNHSNSSSETFSGLVNLFAQTVGKKTGRLLPLCLQEWRKTVGRQHLPADKVEQVKRLIKHSEHSKHPEEVYNRARELVMRKPFGKDGLRQERNSG